MPAPQMAAPPPHPLFDPTRTFAPVEVSCLLSPLDPVILAAFDHLVSLRLSPSEALVDSRVFSPTGERWRVADLDEPLHLLSLSPLRRRMLLLLSTDAMDPAVYDRLLKVVEDPPAPVSIFLATADLGALPATLRSRCNSTISLPTPLPDDVDRLLVSAALPQVLATRAEVSDILWLCSAPCADGFLARLAPLLPPLPSPALAVQRLAAWSDDLASAHGFSASASKRLRPRTFLFALAAIEARLAVMADSSTLSGLLAPAAAFRSALARSLPPLPHATEFFCTVSESLGAESDR